MNVRSLVSEIGMLVMAGVLPGCSGMPTEAASEATKLLFEEQSEPPPDGCFPSMACHELIEEGTLSNGHGGGACQDTNPRCVLREPTATEWSLIHSANNGAPLWARAWLQGMIDENKLKVWDATIMTGPTSRLESDVHRYNAPHTAFMVHFWSGNITTTSSVAYLGGLICHEAVHAEKNLRHGDPGFAEEVNKCIAEGSWS